MLLKANKRLNTAYVLKEVFGQLRDYQTEGWAVASSAILASLPDMPDNATIPILLFAYT